MSTEFPSRLGIGDGPEIPWRFEDSALQFTAFIDYPMPVERETLPPSESPPLPPDVVEALEGRLRGVTAETARNAQALAIGTPGGPSSPFDLIGRWEMTTGHGTQRCRCAVTPVFPAGETAGERYSRLLRDAGWGTPAAPAVGDTPPDVVVEIAIDDSRLREALEGACDQLDAVRYALAGVGQSAASETSAMADLAAVLDPELEAAKNWPAQGNVCAHVCGPNPGHVCDARAVTHLTHPLPSGGTRTLPLCRSCADAEGMAGSGAGDGAVKPAESPHVAPRDLAVGGWVEAPVQRPPVDRLFVIAATRVQFTDWCREVGISPRSRRVVHLTDHRQVLPHGLRYLVLDWPTGPGFAAVAIRDALRSRDALGVSGAEYEAWRASVATVSGEHDG